jgi:multidrug efflux system membrane fusion protein
MIINIKHREKTMRLNILIRILSVFIASIIIFGCNSETEEIKEEIVPVKTALAEQKQISIPITTSGTISSSAESKLSFKTGGIISKIYVSEGERVSEGKLLASLALSEIEAKVKQAKNGFIKAKRDFERVKNLYNDSVATLEQYQDTETAFEVAKSNLEIAEFNYKHSKITAPAKGKILMKLAEENEVIAPGSPVLLFGTSGKNWRILVGLTDKDILKVKSGDEAKVKFDAYPGKEFSAIVTEVGQSANPMNGTYEVELSLESKENGIRSGFIASVKIFPAEKSKYWLLPAIAVVEADRKEGFVFKLNKEQNGVRKIPVTIGQILPDQIAVNCDEDLSEVVAEGAVYLSADSKIKVVN